MALVNELYLATKALYEHLAHPLPKDLEARSDYVEEMEHYLQKRAALLEQLSGEMEFTEAEKSLGAEMFKMNEEIQRFMESSRGELRLGMKQLKKKKQSNARYERPYAGPTVDGIFFDKKN